jgi:hypothetical protein
MPQALSQKKKQIRGFSCLFLFLYGLTIFCFLSLFSSGVIESEDGWLYLSVARNIYYQHKIIAPAQTDYPSKNVNMNSFKGADGNWHSPGSLGYSLTMLPAVALSDVFHRYYHSPPPTYFPLESDWSVLFFASFNNIFWASCLAVLLILYGQELGWSKKESLALSLLTIFATNIFPMAKFGFAQTLYTFFLMLTFYLTRKLAQGKNILKLVGVALSFIGLMYAYNISFYLTIVPLLLYYFSFHSGRKLVREMALLGTLVLIVVLIKIRLFLSLLPALKIQPKVLFEGVWGFLFSSGKSVFLYSPPLLILPIFWHKLNKKIRPEVIGFGSLCLFFLVLIGSAWIPNPVGKTPIWNGGMAWGPRYLIPLIPGLMILCFSIFRELKTFQKRFIFYPLVIISICIQLAGVSVIYLLQYTDIPYSIFVGKEELSVYDYASFIPRYSPLWKLPHVVLALAYRFPETINHGQYNVRLYDGFDVPLHGGVQTIRGFREEGHISLDNSAKENLESIQLTLLNLPDTPTSSESARITLQSQTEPIATLDLAAQKESTISLVADALQFKDQRAFLDLSASYSATPSAPHVIYIKQLLVNNQPVNLGSLDYPDVSSLGYQTTPVPYQYYGGKVKQPWKLWDVRARMNERTFDFWWIKNLYYWDRPQRILWLFLGGDIIFLFIGLVFTIRQYKQEVSK